MECSDRCERSFNLHSVIISHINLLYNSHQVPISFMMMEYRYDMHAHSSITLFPVIRHLIS